MLSLEQRVKFSSVFGKQNVFFESIISPEAGKKGGGAVSGWDTESETVRIGRGHILCFINKDISSPKDELTCLRAYRQ